VKYCTECICVRSVNEVYYAKNTALHKKRVAKARGVEE
jgi:hypothetical protein